VQAGTYDDVLRQVVERLRVEFVDPDADEPPGIGSTLREERGMADLLGPEDEILVARLREALTGIASTLAAESEASSTQAIETALDGAEFVIRGELASGDKGRVVKLMPSFVFLVALSITDQDQALKLSGRTAEVVEELAP
jgi:hypothetical protein